MQENTKNKAANPTSYWYFWHKSQIITEIVIKIHTTHHRKICLKTYNTQIQTGTFLGNAITPYKTDIS